MCLSDCQSSGAADYRCYMDYQSFHGLLVHVAVDRQCLGTLLVHFVTSDAFVHRKSDYGLEMLSCIVGPTID